MLACVVNAVAGTFMDYADATPEPHMTTRSFRALLEGKSDAVSTYRPFVSSGLNNFRMVVKQIGKSADPFPLA